MDVKLHLVKGNPKGKTVEVPAGTVAIGRAENSDVIIASTRVSRNHCEITNDGKRLVIRDKGSANGTFVNGVRIDEHVLQAGDEVQVGPLTFIVEIDGQRTSPAAPPAAKSGARPAAKSPAPKAPAAKSAGPAKKDDIFASLERMAGKGKPKQAADDDEDDDVLKLSDEDLLGEDN
jgi:predicted component of type VI protein secretion system